MANILVNTNASLLEVTLNRPDDGNALSLELIEELNEILENYQHDLEIKLVTITGQGDKFFIAGGDIKELIEQVSEMQQVLKIASIPLKVFLMSDQKTNVVIYKKGGLGLFERQSILLKPGVYTAKGTRIGYRDTTLRFKVDPNQSEQSFTVICRERI